MDRSLRLTGPHRKEQCVLELPAGLIAETSNGVGDELAVQKVAKRAIPD